MSRLIFNPKCKWWTPREPAPHGTRTTHTRHTHTHTSHCTPLASTGTCAGCSSHAVLAGSTRYGAGCATTVAVTTGCAVAVIWVPTGPTLLFCTLQMPHEAQMAATPPPRQPMHAMRQPMPVVESMACIRGKNGSDRKRCAPNVGKWSMIHACVSSMHLQMLWVSPATPHPDEISDAPRSYGRGE